MFCAFPIERVHYQLFDCMRFPSAPPNHKSPKRLVHTKCSRNQLYEWGVPAKKIYF